MDKEIQLVFNNIDTYTYEVYEACLVFFDDIKLKTLKKV